MSEYIDQIKDEKDLPITYSINIKTSKRPLTCYFTATPRLTKQLNYIKPSICSNKTHDCRIKSTENNHRSSIHLPVTYSTSIHVPCHPSAITLRPPIISPSSSSSSSHHHYHHHYYYHHYNHRQPPSPSSRLSTKIKPASIGSTRPTTTSTTTTTSPQSLSLSKKSKKNIHLSLPNPISTPLNKPPSHPPLPSYSALVWNWFHHTPTKPPSHHKGSQSDYSEIHRHDLPRKRSLLLKFLTSPTDSRSKSKHSRTCFRRKRFESSSSLPNKFSSYNE